MAPRAAVDIETLGRVVAPDVVEAGARETKATVTVRPDALGLVSGRTYRYRMLPEKS